LLEHLILYIFTVLSQCQHFRAQPETMALSGISLRSMQSRQVATVPYAELHCISHYSFLRGASSPEELVQQAAELGYRALAITDECSMAGVVKAHVAARECGLKLIIGSEFYLTDNTHLILLAPNRTAYGQICNLITLGRRRSSKGDYQLDAKDLEFGLSQCLVIWLPSTQRNSHGIPVHNNKDRTRTTGHWLAQQFNNRLWLGIEIFPDGHDIASYQQAFELSQSLKLPMVACGDVHMHHANRKALQDVVSAIRIGQPLRLAGKLLFAHRERHLRSLSLLASLYPPALLAETIRISDLCDFSLDELRYEYPQELVPRHLTPPQYLRQLVEAGATKRWPQGTKPRVQETIEKELQLIEELQYEYYFLTVYDIVQFAREAQILCQGRGSAANSAVCYCLEITEVDPAKSDLLFERFISKERDEPPDIDVDFEHERREEVIQYIYKKYGRHRAALAASVVTYRPKSAVRDVGKALGMDLNLIEHLASSLSWWDKRDELLARFEAAGINPRSPIIGQFIDLIQQLLGTPRHLSQHVGGFIISSGPLSQLVPIENAAMPDRTIIQWDKYDLESLGLLKVDILALGMLTAIRKTLDLINQYRHSHLTLASIPTEDPLTYQMLQRADSLGVFQVESRAQMSMLPRLKPACFYDLVIEVAIVRPGPIQGNMVHPYLLRRNGEEAVIYANEAVKSVLERTLGIPIFQEQVIKLAVVAAGFSPGEADQLRRAMAAWKRKGGLEVFQQKLINGMLERGHNRDFAERIYEQIKGFGDYGFPESHAASFALLVYFSAWLKCHEPAAFYCGLLNSQPMGFYSPSQLVQDARRHNIEIRPVDIRYSDWESTLETPHSEEMLAPRQPAIRLGLQRIKGLKTETIFRILHARKQHSISDLDDIAQRARLDRGDLARLTEGGAFKGLSGHRYQTHWQARGLLPVAALDVNDNTSMVAENSQIYLSPPAEADDLRADYQSLGLTLGKHPLAMLRESGRPFSQCKTAAELTRLNHGQFVQVAGIVTGRQRPSSAAGVLFLTLEDETDNINVVVWRRILEQYRTAIIQGRLLKVKGIVERQGSIIHVIAGQVEDLSHHLDHFALHSRDFK